MSFNKVHLVVKWIIQQTFPFLPHNLCLGTIHGIRKYQTKGFVFKIHILATLQIIFKIQILVAQKCYEIQMVFSISKFSYLSRQMLRNSNFFFSIKSNCRSCISQTHISYFSVFSASRCFLCCDEVKRCSGKASASFGPNFCSRSEILL